MNVKIGTAAAQFLFLGIYKWDFRCSACYAGVSNIYKVYRNYTVKQVDKKACLFIICREQGSVKATSLISSRWRAKNSNNNKKSCSHPPSALNKGIADSARKLSNLQSLYKLWIVQYDNIVCYYLA